MNILVTNDDGYKTGGLKTLVRIMRRYGNVTVVAPKYPQSGMSMALTIGMKRIAVRHLGDIDGADWYYLDGTPTTCIKYGIGQLFADRKPDLVVSGINHGSNAASASCYSGTLGAAEEAALNGIPAIGVSLDNMHSNADFSAVAQLLPGILDKLIEDFPARYGVFYNINFPKLPLERIVGVRVGHQGRGHWEKEFSAWDAGIYYRHGIDPASIGVCADKNLEEGETEVMMVGEFVDDDKDNIKADHRLLAEGFISIVAHNVDTTDFEECGRLADSGIERNF